MKATRNLRRPRVLIVGCGDVGMRCVPLLRPHAHVFALTSHAERSAELRAAGVTPLVGDLDARRSLKRLAGLAPTVLHLAPPQKTGDDDRRTRALLATLSARRDRAMRAARGAVTPVGRLRRGLRNISASWAESEAANIVPDRVRWTAAPHVPVRLVYASTTGVYGDCGGAWIDETRAAQPANARAKRRVSAERQLRRATARGVVAASIARIPGIYASNRLPLARLAKRTPALIDADDVYTNHIHADDLAAILVRLATHGRPGRVIHASDDTSLKMGEYFDAVADAFGLERAPRITRAEAEQQIEPTLLSFMRESRRLVNRRLKEELRVRLRYPSVEDFFAKRGN
ncbi:NAD-dependent epimerase/dehydratase family protein [Paraburkholderia nemoris]|uniref:NAD-dependent epimerase/dehydratase domain-containing protein n=1 Tax=Paraburkholderia nemoris TaxID=2793076 RepID=A0ABM8SLP1_9BURK|nr:MULTISPECIES: NAD-dependent epimerase/dehydratase family protein [Paraburkholderia]KPD17682.1 NAD-dependent dehydratase [Burkholderia sp. ST111]MBK5150528.1 sugar nucleotide-binding protein [Burkholderia sp. R-69608]MBK3738186.1 sugar nucleotide-binding protein [Paraburkholderia aspalathi]MBK3781941.1 sugar nucleotide-binding protein [Paraburkholderia aspalathi]MBK3814141.1 sugar nucleotide-binding protein [Paraburkholderia aspalathi]